jgi:hypothetical protein
MVQQFSSISGRSILTRVVSRIVERFENKAVVGVIDEFNHLRQRGTLEEYKSKFEELRVVLLRCNPYYDDEHFRQSFIGHRISILLTRRN